MLSLTATYDDLLRNAKILMVSVEPGKLTRFHLCLKYERPHGKTNNLHRRKQRRRSASR